MNLRSFIYTLIALVAFAGFFTSSTCQYYDLCEHAMHSHVAGEADGNGVADQGDPDGCQCLCHFLCVTVAEPTVAVGERSDDDTAKFPHRDDRLIPGPAARIDHPPQLG